MKKILISLLSLFIAAANTTGCAAKASSVSLNNSNTAESSTETEADVSAKTNALVAYFSCTGTTEQIAEYISDGTSADLYEIIAADPYTEADLNYNNSNSRTTKEQNDSSARPEVSGTVENMDQYDIVFIGYPIWHGQAPRIISTFLESYDFSGKTIIPFCTSHSSGIGSSDTNLHSLCSDSTAWIDGRRFAADASSDEVMEWVNSLNLDISEVKTVGEFDFESKTVLLNSGYEMPIMGLGTYSLSDEECAVSIAALLEAGGRLIDTAYMYGNEAAVGKAVRESDVPREEIFVITKLYPNQYDNAAEAIDEALERMGLDYIDMMLLHHPGDNDVEAYKAMEQAVADGKIRSIGLSNWYVEELTEFLPQVSITPALVQNEIHPYYQENNVIPYIQSLGIVVQGWYPFGGRGYTAELLSDETISTIAAAHDVTSAQVILRWNLQKGVVVIPGSSNPDHIRENLDLFGFELTDEEMEQINALDRNEKHDWY
ncbi:MAG: aldo/keto reductase [Eubacterium sp.]|nr:aldo/keto reductase [Eubacterium sp.]